MTRLGPLHLSWPRVWTGLAALALTVRIWGIQTHSLDFDESFSLYLSRLPLQTLLGKAAALGPDPHPPVYFLMLRGWVGLFGDSVVALRALSVVGGVILVLLVAAWASHLASRHAGILAGLLAATSPYLVWYSQEARMYIWVAALGLGSAWALVRAVHSARRRWWLTYALLGLAALYTHVVGALILLIHPMYLLLVSNADRRRRIQGLFGTALLALLYLPYAYPVWSQGIGEPAGRIYERPELPMALGEFVAATAAHSAPLPSPGGPLLASAGGLLAISGGWSLTRAARIPSGETGSPGGAGRVRLRGPSATVFYLFLPIGLIMALWAARPLFHVKFLTLISPFLLLLWAEGIRYLWQAARPLAPLTVALLFSLNIYGMVHNVSPQMAREDWRATGAYLTEHAKAQDVILVHSEHYNIALDYYYRGPASVTHPFGSRIPTLASVEEILQGYQEYQTVWLTLSGEHLGDPGGIVEGWFRARFPLITELFPARIRIQGYATQYRFSALPAEAEPIQAGVDGGLLLRGYRIDETEFPATSAVLHPPSHWVHVTLFWEATGPVPDHGVRVEMVDAVGQVWGGNLPQTRGLRSVYPPDLWTQGEVLRDDYDVNLNPAAPVGEYRIAVRASDPVSGEPLALRQDGQEVSAIVLTPVRVVD